jgi:hypothetical protein
LRTINFCLAMSHIGPQLPFTVIAVVSALGGKPDKRVGPRSQPL